MLFMGLVNFPAIAKALIEKGRSPQTPAMAVRWATRPDQQTLVGTLESLGAAHRGQRVEAARDHRHRRSGRTARDKFNWYERLPLFGQRIVVTRDRRQAEDLAEPLEALGAEALLLPVIEIREPPNALRFRTRSKKLDSYDWLIFTSANGVRYFIDALDRSPHDLRSLKAHICAIGPATNAAVEALHLKVDLMPKEYVAESLIEAFATEHLEGRRILLPRAAVARDLVPRALSSRGATVDVVEAYQTVAPANLADRVRAIFERKPHWITFTSSSTVTNFIEAAGKDVLQGVKIASIGPITSATLREHHLAPTVEARPHTVGGLIEAIRGE